MSVDALSKRILPTSQIHAMLMVAGVLLLFSAGDWLRVGFGTHDRRASLRIMLTNAVQVAGAAKVV